jgi:2-polyprenyl-6-methoxyphenol hydroxylase-like FAD-dependent oxidoreductase
MAPIHPPQNIAIVGAGIAGIACALAMSRELSPFVPNLKITVYERHDVLSTSGGAINLTPVAQRHLAQLGVLDELDRMGPEGGADVDAIELFSMRSGRAIGSISFTDNKGKGFGGYKGRRVMRISLSVAMLTVAERTRNVEVVFGKKVIGGEEFDDRAAVTFQDGTQAVADLIIGCDGVHSAVRTSLWTSAGLLSTRGCHFCRPRSTRIHFHHPLTSAHHRSISHDMAQCWRATVTVIANRSSLLLSCNSVRKPSAAID